MSKHAHTPGPWTSDFNSAYRDAVIIRQPSGFGIATVHLQHRDGGGRSATAHDAFLIAAAPDLLEAAKKTLHVLEHRLRRTEFARAYDLAREADYLRLAIAKAEGLD